jgi:hypothetical protein
MPQNSADPGERDASKFLPTRARQSASLLLKWRPEFMVQLLAYVDEAFGGVRAYFVRAGVAEAQLDALCNALLD